MAALAATAAAAVVVVEFDGRLCAAVETIQQQVATAGLWCGNVQGGARTA